jgi:hypothetical protein
MHTLFILNFFCWSFVDSKTNSLPQSLRNLRFTGPQKIALGGVAALGLVFKLHIKNINISKVQRDIHCCT